MNNLTVLTWVILVFNAVLNSLEYGVEELVTNMFYLHARMLNVYEI